MVVSALISSLQACLEAVFLSLFFHSHNLPGACNFSSKKFQIVHLTDPMEEEKKSARTGKGKVNGDLIMLLRAVQLNLFEFKIRAVS